MSETTWRCELLQEMAKHGEGWDDVVACTFCDAELDVEFIEVTRCDSETRRLPSAWTLKRVYIGYIDFGPNEYFNAAVVSELRTPQTD